MPKREVSQSDPGLTEEMFNKMYNVGFTELSNSAKELLKQNFPIVLRLLGLVGLSLGADASKRTKLEKKEKYFFRYGEKPPNLVKNYIVRKEKIEEIQNSFKCDNVAAITGSMKNIELNGKASSEAQGTNLEKHASSINGLGGIGKTQLALAYAYLTFGLYQHTIWLNGENLSYSFKKLAGNPDINIKTKDLNGRDKEDDEIAQEVYKHFEDKRSLFIFDNVEDNLIINHFLPRSSKNLHILVTSRCCKLGKDIDKVGLDVFKYEETRNLVTKQGPKNVLSEEELEFFEKENMLLSLLSKLEELKEKSIEDIEEPSEATDSEDLQKVLQELIPQVELLQLEEEEKEEYEALYCYKVEDLIQKVKEKEKLSKSDSNQVMNLHKKLQGLPLALQQAIAYIKEQRIGKEKFGIGNYLNEYKQSSEQIKNLLGSQAHKNINDDSYTQTVLITWNTTLRKIGNDEVGKGAIRILNIMAYLAPDNIKNLMFSELLDLKECYIKAIDLLRNYSMINEGSEPCLSNIHRLVQEVIRIKLQEKEEEKKVLEDVLEILKPVNSNSKSTKTDHAIFLCIYASKYNELHDKINCLIPGLRDKEKSTESLLKWIIKENRVSTMQYVLDNMDTEWKIKYQHTLDELLQYICTEGVRYNHQMVKVLIQYGAVISFLPKSNDVKLLKALNECGKLDKEQKLEWLVEAIQHKNRRIVKFLLSKDKGLMLENCIFNFLVEAIVDKKWDLVKFILREENSLVSAVLKEKVGWEIEVSQHLPGKPAYNEIIFLEVQKDDSIAHLVKKRCINYILCFPQGEITPSNDEMIKYIKDIEKKEENRRKAERMSELECYRPPKKSVDDRNDSTDDEFELPDIPPPSSNLSKAKSKKLKANASVNL